MAAVTTTITSTTGPGAPLPTNVVRRRSATTAIQSSGGSLITTYYYRETNGTRGSTTTLGDIPVGAVVERVVTA